VPNKGITVGGRWQPFCFHQKLLGEDGSVRRGVVRVKQLGLFSPKFGETSSHVFTQSPQNMAVEPGIHSLACWDRCLALPQLSYRWRYQFGIFWIPPLIFHLNLHAVLWKVHLGGHLRWLFWHVTPYGTIKMYSFFIAYYWLNRWGRKWRYPWTRLYCVIFDYSNPNQRHVWEFQISGKNYR
jgi:hypothetical protein